MKKFVIDNDQQFEATVARLHRYHEMKNKSLEDRSLSEEDRSWRLLNDQRMIFDLRRAIRDYLASCSVQDDAAEERLWSDPEQPLELTQPELARAA